MPWWSRFLRSLRPDRVGDEIDEELASHLEEAAANGRDPEEARRAFGVPARHRDASRDVRVLPAVDALRTDLRFGWRQIRKDRVTSAAAILSLGLAMGSSIAVFRIVDAVLFRPLPVAHPERLFDLVRLGADAHGAPTEDDSCEYPLFLRMRDLVADRADLLAISFAGRVDVFHDASQDAEKASRQYVSGAMFGVFGLRPALGRLLTASDDVTQGTHPFAVLSYDYWTRRFGRDPAAIGRTFRVASTTYQIVGVAPAGFTGTEVGVPVDFFVPAMMNPSVTRPDAGWFRAMVALHAGVPIGDVLGPLRTSYQSYQQERAQGLVGVPPEYMRAFLNHTLVARPAGAGVSSLQRNYTRALTALAGFVVLVLLIACANISSLKIAQAEARSREMALRVSIGAGRGRLVQLVFVESAIVALAAGGVGALVAWWAAPFVVSRLNPPANAVALALPVDGRVVLFSLVLTCGIALLFGLLPALRASGTAPVGALKGPGAAGRRRPSHLPLAAQVAFCTLVLLVGGLFVSTFERLAAQPVGFSAERLMNLDTIAQPGQPLAAWNQLGAELAAVPGVESTAVAGWALLSGDISSAFIWINGAPTDGAPAYFLGVSPGWIGAVKIPLVAGRDLRETDRSPGAAIVNEAFAREYFPGRNPLGQVFERQLGTGTRPRYEIVGVVGNARYRNIREAITPTAYVPLSSLDAAGLPRRLAQATIVVRTAAADPVTLAAALRGAVRATSGFRVSAIQTQQAIEDAQTVRERLLATLAWFFASVALALTAIGIYGVLYYSVQQRQREIGICRAIGARGREIVWRVTGRIAFVLAAGTVAGLAAGLLASRSLTTLLFGVRATDVRQLAVPSIVVIAASLLAALPPVLRALRVNPTVILRNE
jgi:putative ABC transport system permease protein